MVKQYRMDRDERARCIEMRNKGYTYQHIADVLGRNVKTVRRYLNPIEKKAQEERDAKLRKEWKDMIEAAERRWEEEEERLWRIAMCTDTRRDFRRWLKFCDRHWAWQKKIYHI